MRVVVACGILICLAGCQDATLISKIDQMTRLHGDFQKTLTEIVDKNHELEVRLADTTKQLQENKEQFTLLEEEWKRTEFAQKCHELTVSVANTTTQIQEHADKFALIEAQWKRFEAAFLPEHRQVFEQNSKEGHQLLVDLKAIKEALVQECSKSREGMVAEIKATKEACDKALSSLRITVDDTSKLKDQCVQHAKEANDVNLVGALKESVSKLDQSLKESVLKLDKSVKESISKLEQSQKQLTTIDGKVTKAETDVTQVKSKITQLESSNTFMKMDVQAAKSDLQLLKSKVK